MFQSSEYLSYSIGTLADAAAWKEAEKLSISKDTQMPGKHFSLMDYIVIICLIYFSDF